MLSENLQNIPVGLARKPITMTKSSTDLQAMNNSLMTSSNTSRRKTSEQYLDDLNNLISNYNVKKDDESASKITDLWFHSQANMDLNSERKIPAYLALYLRYCQWIG